MNLKDYIDTIAPTLAWLKAIGDEAKRKGLNKPLNDPGAFLIHPRFQEPKP